MGILDYIRERDIERSGIEPSTLSGPVQPVDLRRACPQPGCGHLFKSDQELRRHLASEHPLGLPLLTLRGNLLARDVIIRVPEEASAWGVIRCDDCQVAEAGRQSRPVKVSGLPKMLAGRRQGRLEVTLMHRRTADEAEARSHYTITFAVPTMAEIEAIDTCFLKTVSPSAISVEAAEEFFRRCSPLPGPVREYAGALANYLIGCAIKEGREDGDHRLNFEHFKDKFSEALSVLSQVPSPLARAVAGVIRFNLNEFQSAAELGAWMPRLAIAGRFFLSPQEAVEPCAPSQALPDAGATGIPVDQVTECVARLAVALSEPGHMLEALELSLDEIGMYEPLAEMDRQKLAVIRAVLLLRRGATDELKLVVGKLRGDPAFGSWAQELTIR